MQYAITYETWDKDSITSAEADDKGFSQDWESCDWETVWDIQREWMHAQNNGNGTWTNKSDKDFHTGETTISTLHFKDADCNTIQSIFDGKIKANALAWAEDAATIRNLKGFTDSLKMERALELLEEKESYALISIPSSLIDLMALESVVGEITL